MPSMQNDAGRERRTCRRSRFGCRNCKLRKLKCDEDKPHCKRCRSYGVLCNFVPGTPDLQPAAADGGTSLVVKAKAHLQRPICSAIWTADKSSRYQLNARCQDFISRYLGRSLIDQDDSIMIHVNHKLLRLSFTVSTLMLNLWPYQTDLNHIRRTADIYLEHPFLMHASLAVALTYDRHLNSSSDCRRSLEECHHWSQSTALLNKRLREPIQGKDRDAIWATAAALAILTFSTPNACTPEESWPLKISGHSDLDWVHMSESKMLLWHLVNPLRPDSLFSIMAATYAYMFSPLPERGMDDMPKALAAVCLIDGSSTAENNVYFYAAHAVSRILKTPDSEVRTGQAYLLVRCIQGPFKDLLRNRDPVALLLLYLWYRKAGRSIWWIELRARVECPSICSYLQLYYRDNDAVQELLAAEYLFDE